MVKAVTIFWDKKTPEAEAMRILKDELHPRFIEYASLLLARTNSPKDVFISYLKRELFIGHWTQIKRRMKQDKWNGRRIIFWDEIYHALRKKLPRREREPKMRPLDVDAEMQQLCLQMRERRKNSGLTQVELAKKTGLSQQAISFVEKGYVNVSLRTLKKITDALQVKIMLADRQGEERVS